MFNIIPEPKKINFNEGSVSLNKFKYIYVPSNLKKNAIKLAEVFIEKTGLDIEIIVKENHNLIYITNDKNNLELNVDCGLDKKEGYYLTIRNDVLIIKGCDSAGAFYGLQTLTQIIEDNNDLPCCEIRDWPDMEMRGIHFDLKGSMPKYEYLKMAVNRLAHFKINTILIEYENKIILDSHPSLAINSALTKENVNELIKIAHENHIQLIPLFQTLGHAEYILRHEEYAHLRETSDFFQQMCPSNPDTFKFVTEIIDEMMEIHKESKYFHIGGDETRQLGECKICSSISQKTNKYILYLEYMKKICEYVVSKGKTPIIWDDMLTRHLPEYIDQFPSNTIFMYWLYNITSDKTNYLRALHGTIMSKNWTRKQYGESNNKLPEFFYYIYDEKETIIAEDLPQDKYNFFKKYSNIENYPKEFDSTIFLNFLRDKGRKVIGGSTATRITDKVFTLYERVFPNIKLWADVITRNKELGVITTAWARSNGMSTVHCTMEGLWYPFIASGEYYWNSKGVTDKDFDKKFCKRFYGFDNLEATDSIWLITHQKLVHPEKSLYEKFIELSKKALKNKDNLRYYALISRLIALVQMGSSPTEISLLKLAPEIFYEKNNQVLVERSKESYNSILTKFEKEIKETKKEVEEVLGMSLHADELKDYVSCIFGWQEYLLKFFSGILDKNF